MSSEAERVAEEARSVASPKISLRSDADKRCFFDMKERLTRFTVKLACYRRRRGLAKEGEENGGWRRSGRGGACSAAAQSPPHVRVLTVEEE